jgi:Domain of unknown function (DUF4190)
MTSGMPPANGSKSSKALWSLILGILGIICCQILAPIAWVMGNQELRAIKAGQANPANQGMAMAGMIMGIVGTVLLCLSLVWVLFFGGMAILSGMMSR